MAGLDPAIAGDPKNLCRLGSFVAWNPITGSSPVMTERYRPVIDCRRTRRSMMVCSTTDSTITSPKQSCV